MYDVLEVFRGKFWEEISRKMEKEGLSGKELAARIGKTSGSVYHIKSGHVCLSPRLVEEIATAFGCPPTDFEVYRFILDRRASSPRLYSTEIFNKAFRELLEWKFIEVAEFARKTGIRKTSIYDYLSARTMPEIKRIVKMARWLDVSPSYFREYRDHISMIPSDVGEITELPFPEALGGLLSARSMTLVVLSRATGMHERWLSSMRNGAYASYENMGRIAEALGVEPSYFREYREMQTISRRMTRLVNVLGAYRLSLCLRRSDENIRGLALGEVTPKPRYVCRLSKQMRMIEKPSQRAMDAGNNLEYHGSKTRGGPMAIGPPLIVFCLFKD